MTPTKAEQCYQILRAKIMDGTYGPGHRLVIDQLVREHSISSVPWRESLRRLEAEGWLKIVPNVGAMVETFDTNTWKRTLSLVARLQGYATALSAPHMDADDVSRARELNAAMDEALHDSDPATFGRLNRDFHRLLASRCTDQRLLDLVETEWTRLELTRRFAFWYAPGRAQTSVAEHEGLIDLIEGGATPEVIENAAKRHELNTVAAVARSEQEEAAEEEQAKQG